MVEVLGKIALLILIFAPLLRELRMEFRRHLLRRLERETGMAYTEVEVFGTDLKSLF